MARPSLYSPELASKICQQIMEGDSLRTMCKADEMPACSSVYKWLAENPEFAEQYARAREVQAEYYASEIIDIADEIPIRTVCDPDGGTSDAMDAAGVQRNKLRVDARKWVAAKLLPKKYGDKQTIDLNGTLSVTTARRERVRELTLGLCRKPE